MRWFPRPRCRRYRPTSRTLTFCAISLSVSVRYPVFNIAVYVIAIIEWNHVAKYFSG
jgi:hypothetical protein